MGGGELSHRSSLCRAPSFRFLVEMSRPFGVVTHWVGCVTKDLLGSQVDTDRYFPWPFSCDK